MTVFTIRWEKNQVLDTAHVGTLQFATCSALAVRANNNQAVKLNLGIQVWGTETQGKQSNTNTPKLMLWSAVGGSAQGTVLPHPCKTAQPETQV